MVKNKRKWMKRTIKLYHYKIISTKTNEVIKEETVRFKVTKKMIAKDYIRKNGFEPIEIKIDIYKEQYKMEVDKFIENAELVEDF